MLKNAVTPDAVIGGIKTAPGISLPVSRESFDDIGEK